MREKVNPSLLPSLTPRERTRLKYVTFAKPEFIRRGFLATQDYAMGFTVCSITLISADALYFLNFEPVCSSIARMT
jgi:hypothetical protein